MRILRDGFRPIIVLAAALAALAIAHPSTADPERGPDTGGDDSPGCSLWSGDIDETNATSFAANASTETPELCLLAKLTDIPLDAPPEAVEEWNRMDLESFPNTGPDRSAYPQHASRSTGQFIADAYAEIFAVQPSTRAHLSPDDHPHYIAPEGTVLGVIDYRVVAPPGVAAGHRRFEWHIQDHRLEDVRLLVDDRVVATGPNSQTPEIDYALAGPPGEVRTLALEANVTVEASRRVETCLARTSENRCREWERSVESINETVTVRDAIEVVGYDLSVSGFRAKYPNGDLGLMVYKNHPWLGHSVPGGEVRGVWRFYSARDARWDQILTTSENGTNSSHSPVHPLRVHAYPIETKSSASPHPTVELLDVFGTETAPPTLPETIALDVVATPYIASYGIATRTETPHHDLEEVTAYGLVRGVEADIDRSFSAIPINRSNLSVSVRSRTDENLTVRIDLRDEAGVPIDTTGREGYVTIRGQHLETNASGAVTATVARGDGGVSATYVPARWWRESPSYTSDTDVVYAGGSAFAFFGVLFEFVVPTSLFLLAVYFVDRITGWRVWPPWRRI